MSSSTPPLHDSIDTAGRTRAARRAAEQARLATPLKRVVRKHVASAEAIHIHTAPSDYPVTSTGCTPRPLVDKESRVIAILGGRPNDPEYLRLTEDAARELEAARGELNFRADQRTGRRGTFSSATAVWRRAAGNLAIPAAMSVVFNRLFLLTCFLRISGFANRLFQAWNPAAHALYSLTLDALTSDYNPRLHRNFPPRISVFAAATLNFGPFTITLPHIDALYLAWGCPLGPTTHYPLPPGVYHLIPSAILRHSNIPIAEGERRYSFTQFTAAGLFRWVDNGFRTEAGVDEATRDDPGAQAQRAAARQTRWATGINSYMRWDRRSRA
ncbi:hypothetical protein C8R46DRAFT_1226442 [Mycena filopes]|nr:hypothetical protein C8R46DRAFT_1226442 [Mycena filopes]